MWEQEHRERSSYRQHENHCACYQSIREEHRHELVQLVRIIHICRHMISENTMLYANFPGIIGSNAGMYNTVIGQYTFPQPQTTEADD